MIASPRAAVGICAVVLLGWAAYDAAMAMSPMRRESEPADAMLPMDSPAAVASTLERLREAIVRRPSSPYAWASWAAARYRAGMPDSAFETALVRASELGPNEPQVQETVAYFGLAVWDQATIGTRAAVDRMIGAGVRRDASRMLQIAGQRGRLDAACRHLGPSASLKDPSIQACGVRGTT
jgi:hypothetical protein